MVLKLYCTSKVFGSSAILALILKETKIPYQVILVDMSPAVREQKTEKYMETLHPFGQIPALDDDGFILYESRAIARYILTKYASHAGGDVPRLIPSSSDLRATARFEQAMSVQAMDWHFFAGKLYLGTLYKEYSGLSRDDSALPKLLLDFEQVLDAYERILKKTKYLAGDEISVADFFHLQMSGVLTEDNLKVDVMHSANRPNVARWWDELVTRPSWIELQTEGIKGTVF
ncbi:Glutathione S-transferase [Mycena chlorophos]|uniref:glutathione transferase n=1 Tax=Mycena chlorophos TaxID=658473 RepID=A0A8H6WKP6_MYCCL|nr:Glutathione S-transferase [Mycena chlorophos]